MKIRVSVLCVILTLAMAVSFASCKKKGEGDGVTSDATTTLYVTQSVISTESTMLTTGTETALLSTETTAESAVLTTLPTTEAPTTLAPATEAPATVPPATEAPATQAPATQAPTTAPTAAPTPTGPVSAADAASKIAAHSELFEEQMVSAGSERAISVFGLDPASVADCAYYAATAAVAEEVLVVKASNAAAVNSIVNGINERKASQLEDYADYVPKEVPKLQSAVTVTKGDYVVFCVSGNNAAAAEIINGLF